MVALAYIAAFAVIFAAAWILVRRLRAFILTKGQSACDNCPYSRACRGHCTKKDERR